MTRENESKDIGYKKPPAATQFKKGQSGNPKGRPKGSQNNKKIFESLADTVIEGKLPNGKNEITLREGVIAKLASKAMQGDQRAMAKFIDTMAGYDKQNEDYCREADIAAWRQIVDHLIQALHNAGNHFDDKKLGTIVAFLEIFKLEFYKLVPEFATMFDENNNVKREVLIDKGIIGNA